MLKEYMMKLSSLHGVSGREHEAREFVREELSRYCDEVSVDALGNVIGRIGDGDFKIMFAAHMDEIGMVVRFVDKDGFIRFTTIGGVFEQNLLARKVVIRTSKGKVYGVIGSKPPHIMKEEERKKPVPLEELFIDVGARSREEVEKMGIRVGDPVVIVSEIFELPNGRIVGKALDDRAGCAVLLELVRRVSKMKSQLKDISVYFVATVQEEVGLKGARVVAFKINPHVAFAIDVCPTGDHPGVKEEDVPVKLGKGPTVTVVDGKGYGLIAPENLIQAVIKIAEKKKVPYQLEVAEGGTTDATIISLTREGIPATAISIPLRYVHSPVEMLAIEDAENTVKLCEAIITEASLLMDAVNFRKGKN